MRSPMPEPLVPGRDARAGRPGGSGTAAGAPFAAGPLELAGYHRLLAELFSREPDERALALAAEVPQLREHAAPEAAARYTHVFVLNAYPFASVYLDPGAAIGGERTGFTRDVLAALGLEVEAGVAADHAAVLLEALAALLEREAAGDAGDARRSRHAQGILLAEHLLTWAPLFLGAVERADDALYGAAARLCREALVAHAAALFPASSQAPRYPRPPAPAEEDGPRQGPHAALAWLTVPSRCGMFLSRADIAVIAAQLDLPVRFGGRAFMLESVARAAVQSGTEDALGASLAGFAAARSRELAGWAEDLPALAATWQPWRALLASASERLGPPGPPAGPSSGPRVDPAGTARP